jgi:hypothetical protein
MPFDCLHRQQHGQLVCLSDCPALRDDPRFEFVRVEAPADLPPADPRAVEVAVLDMHHGWPNLGHAAIVHVLQSAVCDIRDTLDALDLRVRVISYDVRRRHMLPEPPGGRHGLYLGTGGPGHLDPAVNDGLTGGSQGIREDGRWERPLFDLFSAIRDDEDAALFGVCHTFGVMCRWLGVADAVMRGPEKGGKSAGITEGVLTAQALEHPWFSRFAEELPDHRHLRILDNRLYDLIPRRGFESVVLPIGFECLGPAGAPGDAVTMVEVARDASGIMPRVFGVNHHPEVVNRPRLLTILLQKRDRGEVDEAWFDERLRTLTQEVSDEHGDRLLHLTSSYTFLGPVRFFLFRLLRQRAEGLGLRTDLHEERMPILYSLAHEAVPLTR